MPAWMNLSAICCLRSRVPLLASYMTTCPCELKKSHISCSHPAEIRWRSATVSGLFSPAQSHPAQPHQTIRQRTHAAEWSEECYPA